MGDVGIEATLVLDGLAVSKVRFYSTLDSDVGKRVEITDKFNPLNVFTGTFDESLNLLYDLPAFTSYQVKMYGLDGETVESDQSFMLKGYDYLEKNVGLNKNSFAGIKAIVDQGLENTMLEVGHTWVENDNADGGNHTVHWVITAINYRGSGGPQNYRHNVMISRKEIINGTYADNSRSMGGASGTSPLDTYYQSLPSRIKDCLTKRVNYWWSENGAKVDSPEGYVYILHPSEYLGNAAVQYGSVVGGISGQDENPQHPYFTTQANRISKDYNGNAQTHHTRGLMYTNTNTRIYCILINSTGGSQCAEGFSTLTYYTPCMMIASDPI